MKSSAVIREEIKQQQRRERNAYARGYNTGVTGKWPEHKPPMPPDENVAALITALRNLIEAVDSELATFMPDDELVVSLKPHLDKADGVLVSLTSWIRDFPSQSSGDSAAKENENGNQAKELGFLTSGTYGQPSSISSASASLQRSLESKLQASLASSGLTLYRLTWKKRITPSLRPICALRASAHSTSGNGSSGLPTPSGTSNKGKNHVAGRLDEWGGSSNPFRGTADGRLHLPGFELWMMGLPGAWRQLMPLETPLFRKLRRNS